MTDKKDELWTHATDASQLEQFKEMQQNAQSMMSATGVDAAINAAAILMVEQKFDACIAAYEQIKVDYPDDAAICEHQIGAAWFFKGDYNRAIEHYKKAHELGAEGMDEEILEAQEMLDQK